MTAGRRLDALDVARGAALVAMAGYHFTWDLAFFGVLPRTAPFTPEMRLASHIIGGAFLLLAGVSLALAHGRGFRARNFFSRLLRIGGAAALVTGASWLFARDEAIGFGILHCIFVASLIAVPLLPRGSAYTEPTPQARRMRAGIALALGLALIAAPLLVASPRFDPAWLVWLGIGTREPPTLDWRPLAPWGGVTLIGLGLALIVARLPFQGWQARRTRPLAFCGRHSLAVYLIHQPILVGLLYAILHVSGFAERRSVEAYLNACRPACVEAGGEIEACNRACACVVQNASAAGLAESLGAHTLSTEARQRIARIVQTCGSDSQ